MSLAKVFDKLGEKVVPKIAGKVFPDTMLIERDVISSDGAGGQIRTRGKDETDEPIPCTYKPREQIGYKTERGDRVVSVAEYVVTFATHYLGQPVDIKPSYRLRVQERGGNPELLFRIVDLKRFSGVKWDAVCQLENDA